MWARPIGLNLSQVFLLCVSLSLSLFVFPDYLYRQIQTKRIQIKWNKWHEISSNCINFVLSLSVTFCGTSCAQNLTFHLFSSVSESSVLIQRVPTFNILHFCILLKALFKLAPFDLVHSVVFVAVKRCIFYLLKLSNSY